MKKENRERGKKKKSFTKVFGVLYIYGFMNGLNTESSVTLTDSSAWGIYVRHVSFMLGEEKEEDKEEEEKEAKGIIDQLEK